MLALALLLVASSAAGDAPAASTLRAVVFCDENANGLLDPDEQIRIPDALVVVGPRSGRSAVATGRVTIEGVPAGEQVVSVTADSLPPFYVPGPPLRVTLPSAESLAIAVRLDVGPNRPDVYLAVGDSITDGDWSSDEAGYRSRLQARLCAHFGEALIVNAGVTGSDSHRGARRIEEALRIQPGYTLILYGTNDWDEETAAFTVTLNSLRRIVRRVKAARSLPLLATVIPTNVGADPRASAARNRWVAALDRNVRRIAREEGATLVDLEAAFLAHPHPERLYADGLHPNDDGYEVIASAFFAAITRRGP
jgi:lysophospholipase L1-like esterase